MEQSKYDVFISYSRRDYVDEHKNVIPGNEVSKIKEALTKAGITYWFDEEGVYPGNKFAKVIVRNIKESKLFVFLSTFNSNQSEWTANEISTANMLKKKIIPVRIDDSVYHDDVILYISRLSHIDYYDNPEKGRQELIRSINAYLEEDRKAEKERIAKEKLRQEELERQRRKEEEDKRRQEKMAELERELSSLEAQRIERQKVVLQKEQDLKLAQIDLKACDDKIQKVKEKLENLRNPEAKRQEEKRKAEEERKRREEEERPKESTFSVDGVPFKMIRVEGGSMGTFYIGETQVTQKLWQAVMGNNPSHFNGLDHPVECVSWDDICGKDGTGTDPNCFLYKLNQKTGKKYRLPKESEWEYAAKGGNKSKNYTYAGSDDIDKVAWYWKNSGDKYLEGSDDDWDWETIKKNNSKTHPVKQLSPNELGIYDMSGNLWEWCQDLYDSKGSHRVLRGGSWINDARICRVANRFSYSSDDRNSIIGFRLALVHQ